MGILDELKCEIEQLNGSVKLPEDAMSVLEIANQVIKLPPGISKEVVFEAMVRVAFGKY